MADTPDSKWQLFLDCLRNQVSPQDFSTWFSVLKMIRFANGELFVGVPNRFFPEIIEQRFALRVRGDSMIGAGILSGDKVVVRPQQTADDGQIVVARIGDEATVKRLRRRHGEICLLPENENYPPIDGTDAEIIGIVKAVVREY